LQFGISNFGKNIYNDNVLIFAPKRSTEETELREYGYAVTNNGIYYSQQNGIDKEIPFMGLHSAERDSATNSLVLSYADSSIVEVSSYHVPVSLDKIQKGCNDIINSKYSLYLLRHSKQDVEDALALRDIKQDSTNSTQSIITSAGVASATFEGVNYAKSASLDTMFQARQGHGYAAEYGNNTMDRLTGKNADILGGNFEARGADRIANGQLIQTKYHITTKTVNGKSVLDYGNAKNTIDSCFDKGSAKYIDTDGNMMQIEVPREQYPDAVTKMAEKIRDGHVPNESDPANAKNYVRKGWLTYSGSKAVAMSGTIEGISIDLASGAVLGAYAGGMSFLFGFAFSVWDGRDLKTATMEGLAMATKTFGKTALIHTMATQLSREQTRWGKSATAVLGNKIASTISNSNIAKTALGKSLGLSSIKGIDVYAGGIFAMIQFGPDFVDALSGKISFKQLAKNATILYAGVKGAAVGQLLIPIPIVGAMIGSLATGFVVKNVLDAFVEDDAKEMYQILKEEFIDQVGIIPLSKEEFNKVIDLTFVNDNLPSKLKEMYAYGDSRSYARDEIVGVIIASVISERKHITIEDIDNALHELVLVA